MWAYSLMQQGAFAKATGIHRHRMRAILAPKNPKQASPEELLTMAETLELPLSFAAVGFEIDLEAETARLWAEILELRQEVRDLLSGDADVWKQVLDDLLAQVTKRVESQRSTDIDRSGNPPAASRHKPA